MNNSFQPNFAIHPGKTLKDTLETLQMKQVELSQRTGLTTKTINEIIMCKGPITPDTAIRLSEVFGTSAGFWNNLQKNYDETLARIRSEERIQKEMILINKFTCYKELVEWHYVEKAKNKIDKIKKLLNFFGVSSLKLVYDIQSIAFRVSKNREICKESLACWLRCGEIEAQKINTQVFDKSKLLSSINSLRVLTKESPTIFPNKLKEICASFGVAVSFVPHFKNTYVNGATRWLNTNKALIQLSLRGGYEDIFWFSFFHELGHLVKHGKKEQFIEYDEKRSDIHPTLKENKADEFARDILIPNREYKVFFNRNDFSESTINKFANQLNISPSIVAGRLSHDNNDWCKWQVLRKKLKFVQHN